MGWQRVYSVECSGGGREARSRPRTSWPAAEAFNPRRTDLVAREVHLDVAVPEIHGGCDVAV